MAAHQAPPSLGFSRQEHEWVARSFSNAWSEKWKWSRLVVSDPQRPRGLQPSRLLHPGHFPGRSTGVGCHFLLQCVKVKVKSLSRVRPSATPWTATHQAPPSMDFPGKSTGVGCHCLLRIGVLSDYLLLCSKLQNLQLKTTPIYLLTIL